MDKTWIKLYRKTTESGIMKDHLAWVVFSWLLLRVDRETGKTTFGRFQMSDELGIKPNTLYSIIKRLSTKWKVISVFNQKEYTEVLIVNWGKYQLSKLDDQMTIKSSSNDDNTIQEVRIENKEDINNTNVSAEPNILVLTKNQKATLEKKFPYLDISYEYQNFRLWQLSEGKEFANTYKRFERWLLDSQQWADKKTNLLIADPLFSRLVEVYHERVGARWELKNRLIDTLNNKFPLPKYQKEWTEARTKLKALPNNEKTFMEQLTN